MKTDLESQQMKSCQMLNPQGQRCEAVVRRDMFVQCERRILEAGHLSNHTERKGELKYVQGIEFVTYMEFWSEGMLHPICIKCS